MDMYWVQSPETSPVFIDWAAVDRSLILLRKTENEEKGKRTTGGAGRWRTWPVHQKEEKTEKTENEEKGKRTTGGFKGRLNHTDERITGRQDI